MENKFLNEINSESLPLLRMQKIIEITLSKIFTKEEINSLIRKLSPTEISGPDQVWSTLKILKKDKHIKNAYLAKQISNSIFH